MALINLPLDVVERIVDDLAENDYNVIKLPSIKACALVCHSFLPLCRKHIFAFVTLNSRRPPSPTSDDLNHLFLNLPHLAVHIRTLYYYFNKKEFVAKRISWLIPMFKKLVNLRYLRMRFSGSPTVPGRKLNWMSSPERKVLLPHLHLPTLIDIGLTRIGNFPLADLASCVNLKTLRIDCLECSTPNSVGNFFLETIPATPVMLEWLVIIMGNIKPVQQLCHARRPDGKPIIDFSSLKKITASVPQLNSLWELFAMFRNLRRVRLTIEREASPVPSDSTSSLKGLFTMLEPSLPTLLDIDFEYYIENNEDELYGGPLAGLCHELEKMVGRNVVETIKVRIWVHSGCDCTRWGELDNVLMGTPEGWPALRNVLLLFDVIMTSRDGTDKAIRNLPMTKLVQ